VIGDTLAKRGIALLDEALSEIEHAHGL
jgi:hypothetical protein